jgi:hypothetical protein
MENVNVMTVIVELKLHQGARRKKFVDLCKLLYVAVSVQSPGDSCSYSRSSQCYRKDTTIRVSVAHWLYADAVDY